jgi:5-methyltetrahydrofolate--homocysteine methyltransferase
LRQPRVIGERANVAGSLAFQRLIAASDWDGAIDLTLAQVSEGAEFIDVCLMSPHRDELRDVAEFYSHLQHRIHPPVFIDSLNADAMELALGFCGQGATLNSASLQNPSHLERVCSLVRLHQASVVIACRDSRELAVTAEQKLEIAHQAVNVITKDHGLNPESILLDLLALPVSTSPQSLQHTLFAIEFIHREIPQIGTLIGLSNLSYGLPEDERAAVERNALAQASAAGLDFVILNTARHLAAS